MGRGHGHCTALFRAQVNFIHQSPADFYKGNRKHQYSGLPLISTQLVLIFYRFLWVTQKNECNPAHVEQKQLNVLCNLRAEQCTPHCKNQSIQSHFCKIHESADCRQHSCSGLTHQRLAYSKVVSSLLLN